ncbi:hypothetical protein BA768_19435 [Chryseobacterium sp. CBo1]|uniref:hypothetical protein n=1 Tax=Chryseobacterium sp. CBo1 TaxID=1869230 RepID=UPI0008109D09|nr:hypothetical protein [Chryseobacterium sp. CBo1]OCK50690.1 hypothetical protein BA768_19435 [Chryseobacterium sp. CBo1]
MKLFIEDIIILKEIYNFKKINLYQLHREHKLSPAQIIRCLKKFSEKEILIYNDIEALITQIGISWIEANKKIIFLNRFEYICSYSNDLYRGNQININELYKPKISKIDYTLFKEGE